MNLVRATSTPPTTDRPSRAPHPGDSAAGAGPACPWTSVTGGAPGQRGSRRLSGAADLASVGGRTNHHADAAAFRMDVVWARFGAFEMSIDKVVAGTRMVVGKNLGHNHPVSRLSVLLSGNQQVRIDGQEQSMRAGTALLVPGHVASSCYTESVVSRLHVDIRADEPDLAPILDSVGVGFWAPSAPIMLALGAYVRTLMVHEYREASSRERALIDATLKAVVIPIIVGIPPATHADAEARGHRAAALHHIRSHFVDPALTPTAVAAALGVSVRTLQRQFAADVSVHDWIVRTRLDHALSLLRDPLFATVALTDIAQRSGFGSLRGFRRAVVQATGMTPSDFRGLHSGHEAG